MTGEETPRCGNCGSPHREHTPRREAKPLCRAGGIYRPATEEELDRFYQEAFPEGIKPIATIHFDNPEEMERAKAALSAPALAKHFGPGGGGIDAITAALRGEQQ